MTERLKGQCAFVTGGADGLGYAMAARFARDGARLFLFDIDAEGLAKAADALRAEGAEVATMAGDVSATEDVEAAFAAMDTELGAVDILVNNAGISIPCPTLDLTDEAWDRMVAINMRGVFLCARAAGRRMVPRKSGTILNITSIYGIVAAPARLPYIATKHAVSGMTKALADEWARDGVRVNAIGPGYTETRMTRLNREAGRFDAAQIENRTPLGRLGQPEDIAEMALFLCSPEAAYVTGQVIAVDGGWTAYGYADGWLADR
ncbi:MAG: SDR family oxidoreductase [Proteobacteria bacterium]|nr:SDR family oxidoreductase [Pseudomonadota bacterium]